MSLGPPTQSTLEPASGGPGGPTTLIPAVVPPMPPACRRHSSLLLVLSLLPALGCVLLFATGHTGAALGVFWTTFTIISVGTVVPRCALFGPLVDRLPEDAVARQEVWLTLDDGPDPATTPALLDLLDAHGARAVFFVIGERARAHPGLVREMAARGHWVANHSQSHPAASFWTLRPGRLWAEVAGCQETLRQILGTAPVWFRPPVGHHNLFLSPLLRTLGLRMMMWNCRGFDGVERDAAVVLRRVERGLRPGALVLLHDATPVCVEVLRGTLERLASRGLKAALPR